MMLYLDLGAEKMLKRDQKTSNINLKSRPNTLICWPVLMTLCARFSPRPIPQGKLCLCKTVKHGNPSECHPTALQTAGEQPTFSYKCILHVSSLISERTLTGFLWDQSDVVSSHWGMWKFTLSQKHFIKFWAEPFNKWWIFLCVVSLLL